MSPVMSFRPNTHYKTEACRPEHIQRLNTAVSPALKCYISLHSQAVNKSDNRKVTVGLLPQGYKFYSDRAVELYKI